MEELAASVGPKLLILLGLLLLSFLFSASEAALFSLSPLDLAGLKRERPEAFTKLSRFLSTPRRVLVTLLLGNELANVGASAVATALVVQQVGEDLKWLAAVIMFPTVLLFCELTPKTLSLRYRLRAALLVRAPLQVFFFLVSPAVVFLRFIADGVIKLAARRAPPADSGLAEKDYKRMVRRAARDGSLTPSEQGLIEATFTLADVGVGEVMTPRDKVFAVPVSSSYEDLLWGFKQKQFRRIPVYEGSPDRIVGVVHVKELLRPVAVQKIKETGSVALVMRRPLFVDRNRKLDEIFSKLNREKTHMAFVKGEKGELLGLVTMDDVLSRIMQEVSGPRSAPEAGAARGPHEDSSRRPWSGAEGAGLR
ncbi:MAG: DUF21 domain-containing protein [Nitrospirae bacterium]|nr:DUF21 domain-containing protein [Nitrospirota bacterium]